WRQIAPHVLWELSPIDSRLAALETRDNIPPSAAQATEYRSNDPWRRSVAHQTGCRNLTCYRAFAGSSTILVISSVGTRRCSHSSRIFPSPCAASIRGLAFLSGSSVLLKSSLTKYGSTPGAL